MWLGGKRRDAQHLVAGGCSSGVQAGVHGLLLGTCQSTWTLSRAHMDRLPQTCHETELQILRAITVALGISEDHLVKYHKGHDNQLRLLHYPRLA